MNTAPCRPTSTLVFHCEDCERLLESVHFADGSHWSARGLAMHGRRRFKSVLCWDCYWAAAGEQRA